MLIWLSDVSSKSFMSEENGDKHGQDDAELEHT